MMQSLKESAAGLSFWFFGFDGFIGHVGMSQG